MSSLFRRILTGAGVVSLCTLGSRVLGLVRDVLLAQCLSPMARDAFLVAWTLPNLFRRLFGEGALASAFLPVYSQQLDRGDTASARRLASHAGGALLLALLTGVVLLVLLTFAPLPWDALFPDDSPDKIALVLQLTRAMAPYALLICLVAFLAAMHQARRSHALPAAMPIVLNVVWILVLAGMVWFLGGGLLGSGGVTLLAAGILLAGLLQFLLLRAPERERLPGFTLRPDWRDPELRQVGAAFLPMTFGLGVMQLNLVVDRFLAEAWIPGDGAVSALYLGDRMMQLPQALVGIAVATAAFPELSRLAGRGDLAGLGKATVDAVRLCLALALPAAAGLFLIATPLVELFFAREGSFGAELVARTAAVIRIVSAAVIAASLLHVLVRAHYALGRARAPTVIGVVAVVVNLGLNLALVVPLAERGLATATVVSTAVNALLLAVTLRRTCPELDWRPLLRQLPGLLLATAGMVGVVLACQAFALPEGQSLPERIGRVLVPVLVGAGAYIPLAAFFGVPQVRAWLARKRS